MMPCDKCPFQGNGCITYSAPAGNIELALIGQSPGEEDVERGKPFVGPSGRLLSKTLGTLGVGLDEVLLDNALRCRPPDEYEFSHEEIITCARAHLHQTLRKHKPKAIVCLGNEAWVALHHHEPLRGVAMGAGQVKTWEGIPTVRGFHPAAVLRDPDDFGVFRACIQRGLGLARGTWSPLPKPEVIGTVTDYAKARELIKQLGPFVAFDIETHGDTKPEALDEYRGRIVGIALSDGKLSFFVPLWHKDCPNQEGHDFQSMWEALEELLKSGSSLIAHNAKFDSRWIARHFGFRPNVVFDTMWMHHLSNECVPHKLEYMSRWLLGSEDWKSMLENKHDNYNNDLTILGEYAALDAHLTFLSWQTLMQSDSFKPFLTHKPIPLYTDLVRPLTQVLLDMETRGLKVDQAALAPTHKAMQAFVENADREINAVDLEGVTLSMLRPPMVAKRFTERVTSAQEKHPDWGIQWDGVSLPIALPEKRAAQNWVAKTEEYMHVDGPNFLGLGVMPSSDAQIAWVLFEWLGLTPVKYTKTGPSVDKASLIELRRSQEDGSPAAIVIDTLLKRRKVAKLDSTYVVSLMEGGLVKPDGRVHPSYGFDPHEETGVRSGRLSSSSPNLQNQHKILRPLYIPEEGYKFIEADYSQMEIRCLAFVSQDPLLREALEQEDIHRAVSSWLFNTPYEEVTDEQRQRGKTMNFALLYGMGPEKMALTLGIATEEAESLIAAYFARFPRVQRWIKSTEDMIRKCGMVVSPLGRVRRLPAAPFMEGGALAQCLRQGVNAVVQGLAADITNLALIRLTKEIPGYKDTWHIVNTVHDSVLIEVREDQVETVKAQMEPILTATPFPAFDVPLKADITVSSRWNGELDLSRLLEVEVDE